MAGVLFAVGLACVGMGLPLIATEQGTWDFVGLGLLVAGVVTLICSFLLWWQNSKSVAATATEPEARSDVGVPLKRAVADALTELDANRLRLLKAVKLGGSSNYRRTTASPSPTSRQIRIGLSPGESSTRPTTRATTFSIA